MKLVLTGQPLSTQHCYKYTYRKGFVCGYMDAKCKTLKKDYIKQLTTQYKGKPLKTPLKLKMSLIHGTQHKRDIDNFSKLILDALTGIVFEDDEQIVEMLVTKEYEKGNARVELEVERMGG